MQVIKSIQDFFDRLANGVGRAFSPVTRMDGEELNKFAMAILLAGLIAVVTGKASQILYQGAEEEGEGKTKRGYTIAAGASSDESGVPVAEEKPVDIALYLAKADKAKGEETVKACQTCHDFSKGGPNKVGPNLWGIIGNKRAHKDDYTYSKAIASMGGQWGYQELSEFIAKPQKYAAGTKMGYAGLKDPQARADLLAYLSTLTNSPVPFPKPTAPAPDQPQDKASGEKEVPSASKESSETRSGKQTAAEPAKKPEDAAAEAKAKGVAEPTSIGPSSKANTPAPNEATRQSSSGKQAPQNGLPTRPADNSEAAANAPAKQNGPKALNNGATAPEGEAGKDAASPPPVAGAGRPVMKGNDTNLPASSQAPDAGAQGNDTGKTPE